MQHPLRSVIMKAVRRNAAAFLLHCCCIAAVNCSMELLLSTTLTVLCSRC